MFFFDLKKKTQSFINNFFSLETNYFTIGGIKKSLIFFLRRENLFSHLIDRIRFHIYPKFLIAADFPTHLEVEVASKCQMKCPMCWTTYMSENIKGIMKMELYKKIIDEASKNKIFSVKLSWRGEPMLNPKLIEMIKYAKFKNIKSVAFLTNAELLTEKMSEEIIDSGCDWISVSADGTDDIYNKIRFPAKFEETLSKVAYLKKIRDEKKLKKPLIRVQSILTAVENDSEKFYNSWKNISDKINIIADQIRDFDVDEEKLEFDKYFICPKPFQRLAIAHDGKVHQCIADYTGHNILGDINYQTIKEVWDGEPNKKLRESFKNHTYYKINKACQQCSYGLVQEKGFLKTTINKLNLKVRKFKSVPDIVSENKLTIETPVELIPKNKIEEYKNIFKKKNDNQTI
jgi:radical SAM protein with 4Fe4S-binding SPASM domain